MPSSTSPINILPPSRNSSSSPSSHSNISTTYGPIDSDYKTSIEMMGTTLEPPRSSFAGAKPISMKNPSNRDGTRPRRESLAGSLVAGMSWGGLSVGSFVRDEVMMTGTSPFPYQSPSYHSASYLPKLEANFMRDFNCCGNALPTLHDLLQHYEECHAQQTPQSLRNTSMPAQSRDGQQSNGKTSLAVQATSSLQQQTQAQRSRQQLGLAAGNGRQTGSSSSGQSTLSGIHLMRQQQQDRSATPLQTHDDDMEGVEDMELDDVDMKSDPTGNQQQQPQPSMFGQQRRHPSLDLLNTKGLPGLRTSQPTTPSGNGFGFQNNPTVSSVNTPTLTGPASQGRFSPDASVPGTPAGEMDDDYSNMPMTSTFGNMGSMMQGGNMNFNWGIGNNDLSVDMCIDEPAKRLYSPNGGVFNNSQRAMQQQFAQFGMGGPTQWGNNNNNNSEMVRQFRQQQMMMQGIGGDAAAMMLGEEHKPFRCPVIGCEKAYKNQNGLKYHKTHGHQTQQLHENGDGTFSIVNPETSTPYPGTLGMEKEKPYKCEVCGKRYKNLNGLKYHKQHSPPCNPELKLNNHMAAAGLGGMGVNVAGLPGIGEEGMM